MVIDRTRTAVKPRVLGAEILAFPADFYSWDQPDVRWILGLMWCAKVLHPELFADMDLTDELFYFYSFLYDIDEETVENVILPRLRSFRPGAVSAAVGPTDSTGHRDSQLDPSHRVAVLRLLKKLAGQGMAILLTSHSPETAALIADEVAVLAGGAIAFSGPPKAVLDSAILETVYGVPFTIRWEDGKPHFIWEL